MVLMSLKGYLGHALNSEDMTQITKTTENSKKISER